jgi:hypothetical protein
MEGTIITNERLIQSEDFWDRFVMLAKVCYMQDPEADLYFVFDTFRTKILGGWEYTEAYKNKVDAEIAAEEQRRGYKNAV